MSELLPLADAAGLLGVSVERVRQLVVGGQLPGQRFANVWVVPKDAIAARQHSPGVRGRPLGAQRAWQEIIAGPIDLQRPGRYQRRANIIRCDMSRADAGALPEMVGALIGGVRAAIDLGEQLAVDDSVNLYLPAKSFQDSTHGSPSFPMRRAALFFEWSTTTPGISSQRVRSLRGMR